jgi:hypothetical protein
MKSHFFDILHKKDVKSKECQEKTGEILFACGIIAKSICNRQSVSQYWILRVTLCRVYWQDVSRWISNQLTPVLKPPKIAATGFNALVP